jgi:hypothetical protein
LFSSPDSLPSVWYNLLERFSTEFFYLTYWLLDFFQDVSLFIEFLSYIIFSPLLD